MSKFSGLALEVEKPARMNIVHPTLNTPLRDGDGVEAWIDLHSSDSAAARGHQRAAQRRRLQNASRRGGRIKTTPEEIEADSIDFLVAVTAGWHLVDLRGEPIDVPCTPDNARELYSDPAMGWLVDQVDAFVGDRANFSPASSTSSSSSRNTSSDKPGGETTGPVKGTTRNRQAES